jgi:Bacterial RNA polymerase, alpha chain C terminal domain.
LQENDINTISDLMNSDEDKLVEIKGITEKSLEKMYDSIQSFIEKNQERVDEVVVEEEENEESVTDEPNVDEVVVEEENEEPSANKDDIDSIQDSEKVEV